MGGQDEETDARGSRKSQAVKPACENLTEQRHRMHAAPQRAEERSLVKVGHVGRC